MAPTKPLNTPDAPHRRDARAAGLSGGTGFAGIVVLMPEGVWRSALLVLAPTITIVVSSSWHFLTNEVEVRVADWRIKKQKRRSQEIFDTLGPTTSPEVREKARRDFEALSLLELEISRKRVAAIVSS
jgi:hypothetical protein